jgi:hypothetical protein
MLQILVDLANNTILAVIAHSIFGGTIGAYIRILKGL